MTDTSKYTGAHKERFDDSGKGKGVTGREDRFENSGYVGQYKGAGRSILSIFHHISVVIYEVRMIDYICILCE